MLEDRPRIKPSIAGCYSLPTLDKTMSDHIAMLRLILENFFTHFGSYVDNSTSTPYRPRETVAYTEGERYAASTAHPPARGLPTAPSVALFQSPEPSWVAAYLAHLRARHYASSTQDNALRALKCFAVLMPAGRQATLYQDLTQTTPADIDVWIAAAFQQGLAPGTIVTCRRGLQGFFVFLCDQGVLAQSPIQLPRHQILVPTRLPRPMAEAEVVAFFRVIDTLEDRTMFLLMLRCGLRVSEVSHVRWAAIDMAQGTLRVNTSKGQVDRVVYLSPDVATALRQWHGLQVGGGRLCLPEPDDPQGRPAARCPANPQPHDPLPATGGDHEALFAPFASS